MPPWRWLSASLLALAMAATALPGRAQSVRASLIIDDLGNNLDAARQVLDLPAAVTVAILPRTPFSRRIAELADQRRHEVMLHLPLQSIEHHRNSPGALGLHMTRAAFLRQLRADLDAVPHIRGLNNHMGSLLTRHPGHMRWLMEEISRRGALYFVDSRTSKQSVAAQIAAEEGIDHISRDVFLDPDTAPQTLATQFQRFIRLARQKGHALAIAHPYPQTLQFLKQHLDALQRQGIELVPVSSLIKTRKTHHAACTGTPCPGL